MAQTLELAGFALSAEASFAALGRLPLVPSTVSAEARTIFVTPPPLSCWRIDLAKQHRLLATQQLAARIALLSCSRDSPLPRGHVDCTVACVHADQHSENPSQQRPPLSASPLAYSPRSQPAAYRLAKMGKGGQRPPSDADKGLIASEYGCRRQRGKYISPEPSHWSTEAAGRRTPRVEQRSGRSGGRAGI